MSDKQDKNMSSADKLTQKEDFYNRLKIELKKNTEWPSKYMYKFIMPNDDENLKKIEHHFEDTTIDLKKNYSKTGKYLSVTIITEEKNPDAVINRYKSMEDIKGLVAL